MSLAGPSRGIELAGLLSNQEGDEDEMDETKSSSHVSSDAIVTTTQDESTLRRQTGVRRIFHKYQIFFFALAYMSSWEALVGNLVTILYNGGPASLAWGSLFAIAGGLAQSASLAEMSSMLPIAGAQYHWTAYLAKSRHARFITWLQGWTTWFAWISLLCSSVNFTAYIVQGIATMNYPSWVPERWQTTLIIIAMLAMQALMNMYTFRVIPLLEVVAGILHIALFIVFMVVRLSMAPSKHSAEFVFLRTSEGASGWSNQFVSWNLGLITSVWGFVGFDGSIHMSEEVQASRRAVPRAVFWTIALNGTLAYIMVLTVLFCMGPVEDVLASPYPIFTVIQYATGSHTAATVLTCGLLLISLSSNLGGTASIARLTWAWARDKGLPGYFSYVDDRYHVPVRGLWLPVIIVALLSLINIGSSVAFFAFIALSGMAMFSSYFIAIAVMLHARLSKGGVELGEWNLGRWGPAINIFALAYSVWIFAFLPWPTYLPVTSVNMNYSAPLWAFTIVFSIASWWLWGRRTWPGLNAKVIDIVMADADRDRG